MKKLNKYLMLFVAAFALVGCVDDVTDTPTTEISAKVGDEVQFGLTLPSARTIYGTPGTSSFPIYWVNDDKVRIYSPQALEGRNNAEYKVSAKENQDFADNLTKTGDCGIQWGPGDAYIKGDVSYEKGGHDFYSVYPSGNYTFEKKDGVMWAKGVAVSSMQSFSVYKTGSSAIQTINHKGTMPNCLMTAVTPKESVDYENGVVNLKYTPRSTALWFTLKAQKTATGQTPKNITILGVELKATTPIAGAFDLNLNDGTAANISGSSSISLSLNDETSSQTIRLSLAPEESVSFPIFLAPVVGENGDAVSVTDWSITVSTDAGKFTKKFSAGDGQNLTLAPGKIHKITLPEIGGEDQEWDVSTWMKYIPRNVYLSEISIPGTWNSLNPDCQSDTSIDNQYAKGVRAFHIDTRWSTTQSKNWAGNIQESSLDTSLIYLATADGSGGFHIRSGTTALTTDYGQMMNPNTQSFEARLKQITDNVQEDEYMIVFCTFAQDSYNRSKCPSTWYKAISDACAANDKVIDAKTLTQNSVVGDVLYRVIVVVNLDVSVDSATLPADSKCLFTYVPMKLPEGHYNASTNHIDKLYYSSKSESGISMYTSHAQISTTGTSAVNCGDRGYSYPLTSRDALVESFWDWSKDNYGTTNYAHAKWIYLGLGGYISTSSSGSGSGYDTIENRYAPMVYDRIAAMGKNNVLYYPMGIILMNNKKGSNYTTTSNNTTTDLGYNFAGVCKKILLLNNKYRLQYDPTKPEDYINPNLTNPGTGGSGEDGGDEF